MPLVRLQYEKPLDGRAIRIGRAMRGWSQIRLAQASGVKPWRIWKLENDIDRPRPDEVLKIVGALSTGD